MCASPSKIPRLSKRIGVRFTTKETIVEQSVKKQTKSMENSNSKAKNFPRQSVTTPSKSQSKRFASKIPVRSQSSSVSPQRRSNSAPRTSRSTPSKIPVGAFRMAENSQKARALSTEDDSEFEDLQDEDLKKKLREEKRHGKRAGQLLSQLHGNYQDLLEKYAHAENTIDQLRFKPKFDEEIRVTPLSFEPNIQIIEPVTTQITPTAAIRSSAVHLTPLSSIQHVSSTPSLMKSFSPGENLDQRTPASKQSEQDDLLNQSKNFGQKMKSFLTLMDANQLSLAEQKQVYESIRQDYQRLLNAFHQRPEENQRSDLNEELATMKQLLKDIVQSMTQNLLDKSLNSSKNEIPPPTFLHENRSSDVSLRSSLYNQEDLLNQYKKALTAVNGSRTTRPIKTVENDAIPTTTFEPNPLLLSSTNREKSFVYISEESENESEGRTKATKVKTNVDDSLIRENQSFEDGNVQQIVREPTSNRRYDVEPHRIEKLFQNHRSSLPSQRTTDSGFETTKISREKFYPKVNDENHSRNGREFHRSTSSSRTSVPVFESPMRFDDRRPSFVPRKEKENRRRNTPMAHLQRPQTTNNGDSRIHRSVHIWKPEKTRNEFQRTKTEQKVFRSSLFINPSRNRIIVQKSEPRRGTYYRLQRKDADRSLNEFRCGHCGTLTVFHPENTRRSTRNEYEDAGYESERRTYRRQSSTSSSDTDEEIDDAYLQRIALNEAFQRMGRIEQDSRLLSRSIRRRLKLFCGGTNV